MSHNLYKKFFTILLCCCLCSFPVATAFSLESQDGALPSSAQEEPLTTQYLTSVMVSANPTARELQFFNTGDSLSSLWLPDTITCHIGDTDDWNMYECPVLWNLSEVNADTPGRLAVDGLLMPEKGYALKDGCSGQVTYSAILILSDETSSYSLTDIRYSPLEGNQGGLVPVGGSLEDLTFLPSIATCYTDVFGEYFICPIDWDLSSVNTKIQGVYQVIGTPMLPHNFTVPEDFSGLSIKIFVVADDAIDLSGVTNITTGNVACNWIVEADVHDITVEYSKNRQDGPWLAAPSHPLNSTQNFEYGYYNGTCLNIFLSALEEDTDYYFRIHYKDTYSNILHIFRPAGLIDQIIAEGGIGGDHGGADRNDQNFPSIV